MSRKALLMLTVTATIATLTLSSHAAFAQFPPPPPMGGVPAPGGPPMGGGGPPAFAGRPSIGPGGGGPAPLLGAGAAPRGDVRSLGGVRGGRPVANSVRSASAGFSRSDGYGRYVGSQSRYRAAYVAGAYAAGAYAGYGYGRSGYEYQSDSDCYYVYRRHTRVLVCE
jgi:hypothetical protein